MRNTLQEIFFNLLILHYSAFVFSSDVTTIYRFYGDGNEKTVECHARTDALGYPFIDKDGMYVDPTVGSDIPPCGSQPDYECKWESNGWSTVRASEISDEPPPYFKGVREFTTDGTSTTVPPVPVHDGSLNFSVRTSKLYGSLMIYLLTQRSLDSLTMYVVSFKNDLFGDAEVLRCSVSGKKTVVLPGDSTRNCHLVMKQAVVLLTMGQNKWVDFQLSIQDDAFTLLVGESSKPFVEWQDTAPLDVSHVSFGSDEIQAEWQLDLDGPVNLLSLYGGWLRSPNFETVSSKLCVSLYTAMTAGASILVSVQYNNGSFVKGEKIIAPDQNQLKWHYHRLLIDLKSVEKRKAQLYLEGFIEKPDDIVAVHRIIGCNPEGEEDILMMDVPSDDPKYICRTLKNIESQIYRACPICLNGGACDQNTGSCICPPGFRGISCEEGCGPNRYGDDCGGWCSRARYGCRGMLLCKNLLGCDCATGYMGDRCLQNCEPGFYGVRCQQRCGYCNNGVCDPHTGRCPHGCQAGFYPPDCRTTYAYISNPPKILATGYENLTLDFNLERYNGRGNPVFYQIQYKEADSNDWLERSPVLIRNEILQDHDLMKTATGLSPGKEIVVRIVLLDEDGNSYQGELVPIATGNTNCIIPSNPVYNPTVTSKNESSFGIEWQYQTDVESPCPLSHYNVHIKEDWRWFLYESVFSPEVLVIDRIPFTEYQLAIEAVTAWGAAGRSDPIVIVTDEEAPSQVQNLRVSHQGAKELQFVWNPSRHVTGVIKFYQIEYKCIRQLACHYKYCNESTHRTRTLSTGFKLTGLNPHTSYEVTVSAVTVDTGIPATITATTLHTEPEITPARNEHHISDVTSSSFTVHWSEPPECELFHGYLQGYRYDFVSLPSHSIIDTGITEKTSLTFSELEPFSDYAVMIYLLVTGYSYNKNKSLYIEVRTKATAPGPVRDVVVYEQGRRHLALRWSAPLEGHGSLESFSIAYWRTGSDELQTATAPVENCQVWREMFCYAISSLDPDTEYFVRIQAKNTDVDEESEPITVSAITTEKAPEKPSFLQVASQNDTSLLLQWGHPNISYGALRSFLVNVEEIDSFQHEKCCKFFPINEIPIERESYQYSVTVSGLDPASTYTVSVSGKTVSVGPAYTLTVSTWPSVPTIEHSPEIVNTSDTNNTYRVLLHPSQFAGGPISAYLLIVLCPYCTDLGEEKIAITAMREELADLLEAPFYVAAELQKDDLNEELPFEIGKGQVTTGKYGTFMNSPLQPQTEYYLSLVLVSEYDGVRSYGHAESDTFITS